MPESYEYIKFLASFFIVIIFIYAIYYYIANFTSLKIQKGGEIEIKERKILGKNRFLYIVKIKDKNYLISSDESGMRVLDRWKES